MILWLSNCAWTNGRHTSGLPGKLHAACFGTAQQLQGLQVGPWIGQQGTFNCSKEDACLLWPLATGN
jgi:hypothetical protein